jgi:alpha-L-fucosidase
MRISRRQFVAASLATTACSRALASNTTLPSPFGATPSPRQLHWHTLETYAFLHFTVNTFTDKEWGYGDEDPNVFNPTAFDPDAIISDLKDGGMKAVILTCKHHDGFCLWPTRTTEHCIRNSRWRDGKGDVVRDLSQAARQAGLQFGVYVSPWDRSNAKYATPDYLPLYREQVRELLTNYGPIFEVWFDGANGGDGFYGGAREKRKIDPAHYYEWDKTFALIRQLQPSATIFCPGGDIRWVGNEKGIAGDPCWATYGLPSQKAQDEHASDGGSKEELMTGIRLGPVWRPAECDVSIRPGWFWHEKENSAVKTPDQLIDLYFDSVGRGASFLLNVPPNRRGLLEPTDAQSLAAFHQKLQQIFARDLALAAKFQPSNIRGADHRFGPQNLIDSDRTTYWATDDSVTTPSLTIDFGSPQPLTIIRLREAIQLGQRIGAFAFDTWQSETWHETAIGTSIGSCRLIRLPQPVTTSRLRLRITNSPTSIALSELALF